MLGHFYEHRLPVQETSTQALPLGVDELPALRARDGHLMEFGRMRQRVTLDNPSQPTPDGDGGAAVLWPPAGGVRLGARVPASVEATASAGSLERPIVKTYEGVGSFTVQVRYLFGL